MKKPILLFISLFSITAMMTLESYKNGPAAGGVQATNAPGSSANKCTSCHTGGNFGTISVDLVMMTDSALAVTEYTPGSTYTLTATVSNSAGSPAGYGLQMVALKTSDNSNAGVLASPSANAKLSNLASRTYLEQKTTSSTNVFSVNWTAPAEGSGDVTFYFGANAVNGNGNNGGDKAVLTDFTFSEAIIPVDTTDSSNAVTEILEIQHMIYPNPAKDYLYLNSSSEVSDLQVFDVFGNVISNWNWQNEKIDVSKLQNGVYFMLLNDKVLRFVKN